MSKEQNHTKKPTGKNRMVYESDMNDTDSGNDKNHKQQSSGSDSDFEVGPSFFAKSESQKLSYSKEEDEFILKFVLRGNNILKTSSISLWKHLELKKDKPPRTFQSLKNRFLRNIKPQIFTTFRYLIQDKVMVKKILSKFPELQRSARNMQGVQALSIKSSRNIGADSSTKNLQTGSFGNQYKGVIKPNQNSRSKIGVSTENSDGKRIVDDFSNQHTSDSECEIETPKSKCITVSESRPKNQSDKNDLKNVNYNGSELVVTFQNNLIDSIRKFDKMGIYQKYLNLKMKNKLTRCENCGRGEPDSDVELFNDSENAKIDFENDQADVESLNGNLNVVEEDITLKTEPVTPPKNSSSGQQTFKDVEDPSPSKSVEETITKSCSFSSKKKLTDSSREFVYLRKRNSKERISGEDDDDSSEDLEFIFKNFIKRGKRLNEFFDDDENIQSDNSDGSASDHSQSLVSERQPLGAKENLQSSQPKKKAKRAL